MNWRGILLVIIGLALAGQNGNADIGGGDKMKIARERMVKEIERDVVDTAAHIGRGQSIKR